MPWFYHLISAYSKLSQIVDQNLIFKKKILPKLACCYASVVELLALSTAGIVRFTVVFGDNSLFVEANSIVRLISLD